MKKTKRALWARKETKTKNYLGVHLIGEFYGGKIIEDPQEIKRVLYLAAKKAKNIPLKFIYHKFKPQGISAVFLLAESHISLHSWPEFDYLGFDIFSCGKKSRPENSLEFLKKIFKPQKIKIKIIKRGRV